MLGMSLETIFHFLYQLEVKVSKKDGQTIFVS